MNSKVAIWGIVIVLLSGCATATKKEKVLLTTDSEEAMESIAEVMSGQKLTQEDVENLKDQLRHDPEARSAVEAITDSMRPEERRIKYSPSTGKRYAPDMEYDPETGERLQWLDP